MLSARLCSAVAAAFLVIVPARGAVVALDNTSTFTQPPADNFGFHSVGLVFNSLAGIFGSGVYLGDGWVLSTFHNVSDGAQGFDFGTVFFGGLPFAVDEITARRLHNPDTSFADLAMFRLTTEPVGTPSVALASVPPLIGTGARMMGNGQDRELNETNWQVNAGVWTEVPSGGNAQGYKLVPGQQSLRWGNNTIETTPELGMDLGYGRTLTFRTDWDRVSGQAQATGGDSGGGIFVKNGVNWQLAGVMVSTTSFLGQPAETVVYGSQTLAADVATYKAEIELTMATVPEPGTAMLAGLGALCLAGCRRRG